MFGPTSRIDAQQRRLVVNSSRCATTRRVPTSRARTEAFPVERIRRERTQRLRSDRPSKAPGAIPSGVARGAASGRSGFRGRRVSGANEPNAVKRRNHRYFHDLQPDLGMIRGDERTQSRGRRPECEGTKRRVGPRPSEVADHPSRIKNPARTNPIAPRTNRPPPAPDEARDATPGDAVAGRFGRGRTPISGANEAKPRRRRTQLKSFIRSLLRRARGTGPGSERTQFLPRVVGREMRGRCGP
jgi:hypothetical protein